MPKISTDEKLVDEVLTRGVEQVFPDKESLKKKLMSKDRLKLYCGFDPSAPALHIGNAIQLNKLRQFQELGHEIIFLIGDFTGMIGDPTDKAATRKKMTREEVLENSREYQKQASGYLRFDGPNPARVLCNSQWSDLLTFRDLIDISSNFTVGQMIQRDMFQERIKNEKPIHLHEFFYPLAQGYDSVAMDVDLEIGGSDQMFNMLCGRTLMKAMKNKEKFVLTNKLLSDDSGKKMGKTEGNVVWLNQEPEDMYGALMSWSDGLIVPGLELATALPMEEINEIKKALENQENNPRDLKMKLAYELVKINHGEKAAQEAEEKFVSVFSEKKSPKWVEAYKAHENIIDFMISANLAKSRGDAKHKIEQGAVEIDNKKISAGELILNKNLHDGKIMKVGKHNFVKIKF